MSIPYEVFIHFNATNGVSAVLATMAAQVMHLRGNVAALEKGFSNLRLGVMGAAGVAAGLAGFNILKDISGYAKDLSHELVQIEKFNIPDEYLKKVRLEAQRVTDVVPGTTEVNALKAYGAGYSLFGNDQDKAMRLMEPLAKFAQVLGNATGDYEHAPDKLYDMLRAADLMGKFLDHETGKVDMPRLLHFFDIAQQSMAVTHGRVGPETWFQLAQMAGPALSGLSDDGLRTMAIAAQAMRGLRAGTALMSTYQQMVGGTMTGPKADELEKYGLVGPHKRDGMGVKFAEGALNTPFIQALKIDPTLATGILIKALMEHGKTSLQDMTDALYKIFGRATTQRLFSDLVRNLPQIMGEIKRTSAAMGVDDAFTLQNAKDLEQVEQNLSTSWKNLMTAIAGPATDVFLNWVRSLTNALNGLTDWARKQNPETIKTAIEAFGLLTAGFFTFGTLAILSAIGGALAAGAPLMVGLTALAVLLGLVAQKFSPRSMPSGVAGDYARDLEGPMPDTLPSRERGKNIGTGQLLGDIVSGLGAATADWAKFAYQSLADKLGIGATGEGELSAATARTNEKITAFVNVFKDAGAALAASISSVAANITSVMGDIAQKIKDGILSIPGLVGAAAMTMASDIAAKIGSALSHVNPFHLDMHPALPAEPMRYTPSGGGGGGGSTTPLVVKSTVLINGSTLAEAMSSELARIATFPTQAPHGDTYVGWMPGDWQATTA